MSYVCVTCDQQFSVIPDDAVQITEARVRSYRFADGSVHHLRRDVSRGDKSRLHLSPPEPESPDQIEPLSEPEVLQEGQPEIQPEPEATPQEPESEVGITSMAAAFNRLFKINKFAPRTDTYGAG